MKLLKFEDSCISRLTSHSVSIQIGRLENILQINSSLRERKIILKWNLQDWSESFHHFSYTPLIMHVSKQVFSRWIKLINFVTKDTQKWLANYRWIFLGKDGHVKNWNFKVNETLWKTPNIYESLMTINGWCSLGTYSTNISSIRKLTVWVISGPKKIFKLQFDSRIIFKCKIL